MGLEGGPSVRALLAGSVVLLALGAGCGPTVTVEHKVEPIHITMDINIRIDRELDKYFDFEDDGAAGTTGAVAN